MKQIDLDDLPPRLAAILSSLGAGESLTVVQAGAVVARLAVTESAPLSAIAAPDLPPEERMAEVLARFEAMIHDEF